MAVDEELGDFLDDAKKTVTPLDRLKDIALSDLANVGDDFDRYLDRKARANELDEKIEKTDNLIDQIIYRLYELTDEEIAIAEDAVAIESSG